VPRSLGASGWTTAASRVAQERCDVELGFATLRDLFGAATVGECVEHQRKVAGNGTEEQRTTKVCDLERMVTFDRVFPGVQTTNSIPPGSDEALCGGRWRSRRSRNL
jgi:hypothetical protein